MVSGKVNMNYVTILIIFLGSLGYSGRRSFSMLHDAYNFYGTVNKMAKQYRQREILIQTRTIEKKIEEIPEGEEIPSLEVAPIIQSNSKQSFNQNKKIKNI
jgi:mannose/fructose/N-acetylgalactosamine-specific phosphotransferase system component IIB